MWSNFDTKGSNTSEEQHLDLRMLLDLLQQN